MTNTDPLPDYQQYVDLTRCGLCRETHDWCTCDWSAIAGAAQAGTPEIRIDLRKAS